MMAVLTVAPAAAHSSGTVLAVTIALSVTALVALGMAIAQLRRTSRLSSAIGGLGAASVAGLLVLALAVGYSLATTTRHPASRGLPLEVTDYALAAVQANGDQLKTLPAP
jgi:hypothetical protein